MTKKINLTFLGTSGPIPSPTKNHTAILISYKKENILVDCGEGTQVQFKKARISAAKLTKLLITHWHGDHVLGIPGLLQSLSFQDYHKTFEIYGPRGIKNHIDNVLKTFPSVNFGDFKMKTSEAKGKFFEDDDFYIEAFPVEHGLPSNGYCFAIKDKVRIDKNKLKKFKIKPGKHLEKIKQGKVISYNGKKYSAKDLAFAEKGKKICVVLDGIYEPHIVKYVKDSDILIMESSYSHELAELAAEHRHRTAKQCAEIAKKADVKKLIITHLSDRYYKNPEALLNEARKVFKNSHLVKDLESFEI